jgi:hypothetical protein
VSECLVCGCPLDWGRSTVSRTNGRGEIEWFHAECADGRVVLHAPAAIAIPHGEEVPHVAADPHGTASTSLASNGVPGAGRHPGVSDGGGLSR